MGKIFDLHSHILYGIDDGSQSIHDSLDMLKNAQIEGVHTIALTPHLLFDGTEENVRNIAIDRLSDIRKLTEENGLPLHVILGFEVMADETILRRKNLRQYTIGQSSLILFEMKKEFTPDFLDDIVMHLKNQNLIPVLAHPERYHDILKMKVRLKELCDNGLYLQFNASSIVGNSGRKNRHKAMTLIESGLPFVLGSDAHSPLRPPLMKDAVLRLEAKIGLKKAKTAVSTLPEILLQK